MQSSIDWLNCIKRVRSSIWCQLLFSNVVEIYYINKCYKPAIHVLLPLPESNILEGKLHFKESFTFQNSVVVYRVSWTGTFFGSNEMCAWNMLPFESKKPKHCIGYIHRLQCTERLLHSITLIPISQKKPHTVSEGLLAFLGNCVKRYIYLFK